MTRCVKLWGLVGDGGFIGGAAGTSRGFWPLWWGVATEPRL